MLSDREVRQRLQETLQRLGYRQVDFAKETGIHHSTLSLWLQGKVKGNQARIRETVEQWLLASHAPRASPGVVAESRFEQLRAGAEDEGARGELLPVELIVPLATGSQRLDVLWPSEERSLSPELFARILAEDHGLAAADEAELATRLRRAVDGRGPTTELGAEALCVIALDLCAEGVRFTDRFEWDLAEERNDVGELAQALVAEHALPAVFEQLIAFELHRQLCAYRRFLAAGDEAPRTKKQRGSREPSQARLGESVRLETVGERSLFRAANALSFWGGKVAFANT